MMLKLTKSRNFSFRPFALTCCLILWCGWRQMLHRSLELHIIQDDTFHRENYMILVFCGFFFFLKHRSSSWKSLKRKAVETTRDDAFARKECPAALRTFLMVYDGVNTPLSVVESYCFSPMNISFWFVPLSLLYTFFYSKVLQWLYATEMWYIRRIMRIASTEKKKN